VVADEPFIVPRRVALGNLKLCGVLLAYAQPAMSEMLKTAMGWNFAAGELGTRIMREIVELVLAGKIKPVIGQTIPFEAIPAAIGSDVRGHELEWWTQVRSAFPDMKFSVDLLIESDDLIVSNWTVRGTHAGAAFYGVEPSGLPVVINGTAILRMRDGKIVEHW